MTLATIWPQRHGHFSLVKRYTAPKAPRPSRPLHQECSQAVRSAGWACWLAPCVPDTVCVCAGPVAWPCWAHSLQLHMAHVLRRDVHALCQLTGCQQHACRNDQARGETVREQLQEMADGSLEPCSQAHTCAGWGPLIPGLGGLQAGAAAETDVRAAGRCCQLAAAIPCGTHLCQWGPCAAQHRQTA